MPEEFDRYWTEWARLHPGWAMSSWTEESLPRLNTHGLYRRAPELVTGPGHPIEQFRADLVRYELLWLYGGVWVDCDLEPLRPLPLENDGPVTLMAAWEKQGMWVGNSILGAAPRHPFIGRLLQDLIDEDWRVPQRPARVSGPQFLTRRIDHYGPGIYILDEKLIYPYSWKELHREGEKFPDAYAIHHWHNRRSVTSGT